MSVLGRQNLNVLWWEVGTQPSAPRPFWEWRRGAQKDPDVSGSLGPFAVFLPPPPAPSVTRLPAPKKSSRWFRVGRGAGKPGQNPEVAITAQHGLPPWRLGDRGEDEGLQEGPGEGVGAAWCRVFSCPWELL